MGGTSGRRRSGLRIRIIAWSFVPTTIILLAVALVAFYAYEKVTEDLVVQRNRELARLYAGQLTTEVSDYADTLDSVARRSDINSGSASVRRVALTWARNSLAVFDAGVVLLDTRGQVVASLPERPEDRGADWSDRVYFRHMLRSQEAVFSDIATDGRGGAEVIVVAVPIMGDHGEFRGVLAGMFNLGATAVSALYGDIVKLRIGETGTAYLVDGQGRLIQHPDASLIGESLLGDTTVELVMEGKAGAVRTSDLDGRDVVAGYAPVPGTPWGLVTVESWSSLLRPSQFYRRSLLVLLVLGVLLPAGVVRFGVRRITRPLEELTVAAREVAEGNFGRTINAESGDEIGALAGQFNRMSGQLQDSYAQLEKRVADRTRELAALNAIASVAGRSLELSRVLEASLDKTLDVMGMEAGGAFRLDEESRTLRLVAQRGLSDRLRLAVDSLRLEDWGQWLRKPELTPVARMVHEYPAGRFRDLLVREGLKLVVSTPLMVKGRVLGFLALATTNARRLTQEELDLLDSIGSQIGVALDNARLYEEAESTAAAAERSRLARDLHDAVSQTLFSASLIAEVLPRIWERDPVEGERRLAELRQLTRGALAEMRTLLMELRPTALEEAEPAELLKQLCEAATARSRVPVGLEVGECPDSSIPGEVKVAYYRIAQEALNNMVKHAHAEQARVTLECDGALLVLRIADDGVGFDPAQVSSDHLGVGIMRERAEAIGALLEIETERGQGTRVTVVWPAPTEKESA